MLILAVLLIWLLSFSTPAFANEPPLDSLSAQAVAIGRGLYAAECARCHSGNGTGPALFGSGSGLPYYRSGEALLTFVMENMPNDRPTTLSEQEYVAIVNFLVSRNGVTLPLEGLTRGNAVDVVLSP